MGNSGQPAAPPGQPTHPTQQPQLVSLCGCGCAPCRCNDENTAVAASVMPWRPSFSLGVGDGVMGGERTNPPPANGALGRGGCCGEDEQRGGGSAGGDQDGDEDSNGYTEEALARALLLSHPELGVSGVRVVTERRTGGALMGGGSDGALMVLL
jgi:hypothetical protein